MGSMLYMTTDAAGMETFRGKNRRPRPPAPPPSGPRIADMEDTARAILTELGVDPDGIADQGDVAADLDLPDRRSVSWLRQQYKGPDGTRGRDLEPFPAPARTVGGGGGAPVWLPRWRPLAWDLTRTDRGVPRIIEACRVALAGSPSAEHRPVLEARVNHPDATLPDLAAGLGMTTAAFASRMHRAIAAAGRQGAGS